MNIKLSDKFIFLSFVSQIFIYSSIMICFSVTNNLPILFWFILILVGSCINFYKNINIIDINFKKKYIYSDFIISLFFLFYYYLFSSLVSNVYILNILDIIYIVTIFLYLYRYYKFISDGKITFKS